MIIDYEKNKKLQNKNREKSYLVSSNSLISLGITNYSTNSIRNKLISEVWK